MHSFRIFYDDDCLRPLVNDENKGCPIGPGPCRFLALRKLCIGFLKRSVVKSQTLGVASRRVEFRVGLLFSVRVRSHFGC